MKLRGKCFLGLLLIIFYHCTTAQTPQIDSLNNLINKAQNDTARINLYLQKARQLNTINLDSALLFAQQTLLRANKIRYRKGQSGLLSFIASAYAIKGNYPMAEQNLAVLKQLLQSSRDSIEIANLYGSYGDLYSNQERYDTSNILLLKAVAIIERNGYTPALIVYYSDLGINYHSLADYAQALQYQQKTIKLAAQENRIGSQALALNNMGVTYADMGDTLKSNEAYEQAVQLAEKNNLMRVAVYGYTNLCENTMTQRNWSKGYEYAMKSILLARKSGDRPAEAASLSKAAKALAYMQRFNEAMQLAKQSVSIAGSTAQSYILAQAYSGMSSIFMQQKKYKEAIFYLEKAVGALSENDYNEFAGSLYSDLVTCNEATGNTAGALAAFKKYDENKDSTRSRENIQKATELIMNFDFEKKQAASKAEQDKKDADSKHIKNQQLLIIFSLVIIILAVVIIAVIQFRNNKQRQRTNLLLKDEKQKVETTLHELKSTQQQLIQSEKMASLGELTAGIAHEIQNPLNFVNNFSEVNKEMIDEATAEIDKGNVDEVKIILKDIKDNEEKINHHGKRADAIVKGMLQHSRQTKNVKEPTDINALCDEYLRLSYHGLRAKNKNFNADFKTDFDKSIGKINVVPQDIGRVLLNLFNNAFYAVNEKSQQSTVNRPQPLLNEYKPFVSVTTKKINGKAEIVVSDNGNGIPSNIIDKIFQPFFTTKPTGQGTGLGLSLTYDIITKEHNGTLKAESKEGEGTILKILIPVH